MAPQTKTKYVDLQMWAHAGSWQQIRSISQITSTKLNMCLDHWLLATVFVDSLFGESLFARRVCFFFVLILSWFSKAFNHLTYNLLCRLLLNSLVRCLVACWLCSGVLLFVDYFVCVRCLVWMLGSKLAISQLLLPLLRLPSAPISPTAHSTAAFKA